MMQAAKKAVKFYGPLNKILTSDYFVLVKFLVPLAFTDVITDIGEQFLNRSVAHTVNVVDTLAAFGLAYVIVKLFVGMLREVKQVGVVLVHDRPGFLKLFACVVVMALCVLILLVVIAKTQLGVWLIKDLHHVSDRVSELTYTAIAYLSVFPLIDAISWYHGGVLLQYRHSTLVGLASMADIMAQIFCVAILLYTPLVCTNPIVVPILSAYAGVLARCTITMVGFYRLVFGKLNKTEVEKVTIFKLVLFITPLVFVLGIQRMSRPLVNLLVARFSTTKCEAAKAIAVLTATYPLGHLAYGWLNQLRTVPPTFQKKRLDSSRPVIAGKRIAIFIIGLLIFSFTVSVVLYWIPGVAVAILVYAVSIPHDLALLCVDPLRVFAFYCFTVSVRASLTGWLTLHKQTKLVAPSGFIRLCSILGVFFILRKLGVMGAVLGVLSLFSGFFSEMVILGTISPLYACWIRKKQRHVLQTHSGANLTLLRPAVSANSTKSTRPSGDDSELVLSTSSSVLQNSSECNINYTERTSSSNDTVQIMNATMELVQVQELPEKVSHLLDDDHDETGF